MISWIKFRGDRLKGLETADDCINVEEGKKGRREEVESAG